MVSVEGLSFGRSTYGRGRCGKGHLWEGRPGAILLVFLIPLFLLIHLVLLGSYDACLFRDRLNTAIQARAKITIKVRAFAGICKLKSTLA